MSKGNSGAGGLEGTRTAAWADRNAISPPLVRNGARRYAKACGNLRNRQMLGEIRLAQQLGIDRNRYKPSAA